MAKRPLSHRHRQSATKAEDFNLQSYKEIRELAMKAGI